MLFSDCRGSRSAAAREVGAYFFFSFLFRVSVQDLRKKKKRRGAVWRAGPRRAHLNAHRDVGKAEKREGLREKKRRKIEEKRRGDEACRTRKRPSDVHDHKAEEERHKKGATSGIFFLFFLRLCDRARFIASAYSCTPHRLFVIFLSMGIYFR